MRIAMAPGFCFLLMWGIEKSGRNREINGRMRMSLRVLSVVVVAGAALAAVSGSEVASQGKPPLDYETYKATVQPIFLERREGHVRCYTCHSENNNSFHLERLPAGSNSWTEEQSRKNYASVSGLAVPNDPASSKMLIHPLAPEAGGDLFHSGGRQFESKNDPDWKILAQFLGVK
jgi:hypothetical protein